MKAIRKQNKRKVKKSTKKKNNGKDLERLVKIINEALLDSVDSKIVSNHKMIDESPSKKLREFDVMIESYSGEKVKRVLIECKDYKSPVSLEKVEAFYGKCTTVAGVDRKIMVSSKGFQEGARENASYFFGIETFQLEKVNPDLVKEWIDIDGMKRQVGEIRVHKVSVIINDRILVEVGSEKMPMDTKINLKGGGTSEIGEIVRELYANYADQIPLSIAPQAYKKHIEDNIDEFILYELFPHRYSSHDAWVNDNLEDRQYITQVIFLIAYSTKFEVPQSVDTRNYKQGGNTKANMVNAGFIDHNIVIVRDASTENISTFKVNKDGTTEKLDEKLDFEM